MDTTEIKKIRSLTSFDALVDYLRDELDWPIEETVQVDQLTFEYTPDELGLDANSAVKIREIRQLRPLISGQPWGIFWIDFEPKRLPITIMRRILNALVTKQRSRNAYQATWLMDDLLFISAVGDEKDDSREITFAHFHQESGDLPTLRVLGWDGADTALKIDYIAKTLKEKLLWPQSQDDLHSWSQKWMEAFKHKPGHVIRTADALAARLAELARNIRAAAETIMAHESELGRLRKLHKAFQIALIHDLTEADFADTYAQTITYGLLTAAISRTDLSTGGLGTALVAENVSDMVPVTNPFLKEMLQTFLHVGGREKGDIDFDELGIQDVVELLRSDETDLPAILRDFNNRAEGEDPVIRFYEDFLEAYDKALKVQRGVFYTPKPVVSYIVRGVHELLETEFGLEDGLASIITWGEMAKLNPDIKIPKGVSPNSHFVVILDPATGTATFLVEVIDVVYKTLIAKWKKQGLNDSQIKTAWNEYVPKHLLPRLYGYELMMAPYAIAHMKIGLKLGDERGYRFASDQRANIYLTNALEEPSQDGNKQLGFSDWFPAIAHEAQAVNEVKQNTRFTVVIGNPPYSGHSWNLQPELRPMVEQYKYINGEHIKEKGALQLEKSVQEDYIKFIRFAEIQISESNVGVVGMVTSHGFLDNPSLRGMRNSIEKTFNQIHVIDLHGNSLRHEKSPDGSVDKNVFDIKKTGVAISLFSKFTNKEIYEIKHSELWGDREIVKYPWLQHATIASTTFTAIESKPPFFLLIPELGTNVDEYQDGFSIAEIMQTYSKGAVTGRDAFLIDFDEENLLARMRSFSDKSKSDEWLIKEFRLNPTAWWDVSKARQNMPPETQYQQYVKHLLYRPFDIRPCFYHPAVFMSPRRPVMKHMEPKFKNILLITSRMTKGETFGHVTLSKGLAEAILLSSKTSNNAMIFPLYLYPDEEIEEYRLNLGLKREPNLSKPFLAAVTKRLDMPVVDGSGDFESGIGVDDILHYFVAILHSNEYRSRYAVQLTRDFPRIPLTSNVALFRQLCGLGQELVGVHLLEASVLNKPITTFVTGENGTTVGTFSKSKVYDKGRVYLDTSLGEESSYFDGIPEDVYNFHIGGYQVLYKWLKDRRGKKGTPGRTLSKEDIAHYHKIVVSLKETMRLMGEIDEVIEEHGGWPIK
jgi:hypothetical protein